MDADKIRRELYAAIQRKHNLDKNVAIVARGSDRRMVEALLAETTERFKRQGWPR